MSRSVPVARTARELGRARVANVLLARRGTPPFLGSVGFLNGQIEAQLRQSGYHLRYWTEGEVDASQEPEEHALPLRAACVVSRVRARRADLEVYCDEALELFAPRRRRGCSNMVVFHGLTKNAGAWLGNPEIDRYVCFSSYMKDVLESLLAFPDWATQRCLDPRAFDVVSTVTPPVPCVDFPEGYPSPLPTELPASIAKALARGDVLGHAIQPRKTSATALYAIVLFLNAIARQHGERRRYRVVVDDECMKRLRSVRERANAKLDVDGLFISVKPISNQTLVSMFGSCAFGLCYNTVPESFGFYPLESVYHGCPVFTNGVGNLRHLLPTGHGIETYETEGMAFGDLSGYADVAARIHAHAASPGRLTAHCRKGRRYIRDRYSTTALALEFPKLLERLALRVPTRAASLRSLRVHLSPLVRSWNPSTRRIVSDHRSVQLSVEQGAVLQAALGRPAWEVARDHAATRALTGLTRRGILSLRPAEE